MKKSLLVGFAVGFIAGTANVLNIIRYEDRGIYRSPLTKWKDHLVEKLDYLLFAATRIQTVQLSAESVYSASP